jgi:hypothetical protein
LLLPFAALIGIGVFLSSASSLLSITTPARFTPSAFAVDRDCRDFATRWEAQWFYWQAGSGDPHRLDEDGDGLACEFRPWFDWSGR